MFWPLFHRKDIEAYGGGREEQPKVTQKSQCPWFIWCTSLEAGLPVYLWSHLAYTNNRVCIYSCLCQLWNQLTWVLSFYQLCTLDSASLDFPIYEVEL